MKKARSQGRITSRAQLIQRMRRELEARGFPRAQMFFLVALTGGAGFLASYGLLTLGVDSLPLRYFLSVSIAYLVFLFLLWLWLRTSADSYDGIDDAVSDILEAIPDGAARPAGRTASRIELEPGGGQFGGGGSSGHWEESPEPFVEVPEVPVPDISTAAEAEELAIPAAVVLIIATIAVGVLIASLSVVWSAPILFAELTVDGVLSATLYRRLRRIEPRHWLQSALRRTIVPFAATALLAAGVGWGLSTHTPEARTLGEVFHHPG